MNDSPQIIVAQHLLTMEGERLSPGALAFQDGVILELGPPEPIRKKFPKAEVSEFPSGTLIPGLINAHADLSLTLFGPSDSQGLPRPEGGLPLLMPWVIEGSRYKAKLPLEDQQKAVRQGLDTAMRSGTTTIGDQCRYPIALPLYEKSGLRVVMLSEIENIQRPSAQDDFDQALALADEVVYGKNPRLTAGLAPFSAYTLSKNLLRILSHHAIQMEVPIHLHAALSFSEMEFFYDSLGEITAILFREAGWAEKIPPPHKMTPIQFLHEIGFLKARPSLVGCVHLGPTDAALLAHHGCMRIYAPRAFEYLQIGEIPWAEVFAKKVPWALGTMGRSAGSNLNLWDELRTVWYSGEWPDRDAMSQFLLQAATLGGAKALRLEKATGSLSKGKQADFIVVDSPEDDESLGAGLIEQTREEGLRALWVSGSKLL